MSVKQDLETWRDELRVRIHLGKLDAKDSWSAIQHEASQTGHELKVASREALDELIGKLSQLRDRLRK
jgi:hypothetical protein